MTFRPTALLLALAAFVILAAAPSGALALTASEISCRDAIAKAETKYAKKVLSIIRRCHKDRSSGKRSLSDDCNDLAEADDRGKSLRIRAKSIARIVNSCSSASSLLSEYPTCPAPATAVDNGGATSGIDDFEELGACLTALIDARVGEMSQAAMGLPAERLLSAVARCQASLGKGADRILRAYFVERRKCQNEVDRNGGGSEYLCGDEDPRGKIARAQGYLANRVFRDCEYLPQEEIARLEACADTEPVLAECAQNAADMVGADLIQNAYELAPAGPTTTTSTTTTTMSVPCGGTFPTCNGDCAPGSFCENTGIECECVAGSGACAPATIYRHLNARYGTPAGQSQLSTGWTGKTHIVDVPDDSFDAIDVTCDSQCENCQVSLNIREGDPTTNCRCANNPRTPCTAVGGNDTASCGGLTPECICYFGPALAISSGGTPVCVLNEIREDYSGTMDLRTGTYNDVIKLSSLVHLGISQFAPCPTCNGDTTPYDGVRDGTCSGGLQNGQTCDVNGVHHSFGPVSFDCPPATASNISGNGLQIDLELSSGTQSLTAALPCDSPPGELCPCRVCTGNSQVGCTSNADCAAVSAGTCTAGGNIPIEPNDCSDGICGASGVCEAGPVDTFCDGAVHADGRGFVACNTNADCSALGAGTCSVLDLRRCFNDPIVVSGSPGLTNPVNSAIFCIPPTTNDPVNLTAGLPGPGTVDLDFETEVRCQTDPEVAYEFPDGANCPTTTTTTSSTTTTLPLPPCGSATFPVCAGTCPESQVCTPSVGSCFCTGL